ncbi:MAG: MotA/TolQ/ExbB proton channel family protein [Alphaproteobacteria bacterium]|nr:MotA/TolQ/ExbB proton channel family protein [Alphaproteobacteria bacterium]
MSLDGFAAPEIPIWFWQLGPMRWPLAVCAIVTLAIGVERLVFVVKAALNAKRDLARLCDCLRSSRLLPKRTRDEQMAIRLREMQRPYFTGLKLLRLIGTVSPIIGLLGTILGIIESFKVIAAQSGPILPSLIADGLWEAMLTTAVGLLIALPAIVMAQSFAAFGARQLDRFCMALNRLSLSFELDETADPPEIVELKTGTASQ